MGVTIKRSGPGLPTAVWDRTAMQEVAKAAADGIRVRAFRDGKDVDDNTFAAYSTTPIAIHFASETGRRLKPKGGRPIYHEEWMDNHMVGGEYRGDPRTLYRFTVGQQVNGKKRRGLGPIVAMGYAGGYAEYKRLSTKGDGHVDLTLSGQLAREIGAKTVELYRAVIGITGQSTIYGTFVNALRPFMGLSPKNVEALGIVSDGAMKAAMDRSRKP